MTSQERTAWDAALHTIKKLRANGHTALLAGGCVRDRLLGKTPKDYDVATDAPPQRVKAVFPRARQVGAKFGVMLVRRFGFDIEVATFRTDGRYSDGRHPDAVTFGSVEEDARRRDFSINGLFFDPIDECVIDYVGGRSDLDAGILRTIGDPERRFGEDHLRMLRAVRFAARLGFQIEQATADAIHKLAPQLREISPERVWMELEMILADPSRVRAWGLLVETGLRRHLAPTWGPMGEDAAASARLTVLPPCPIDASLGLAATLLGFTPADARAICRDLRLSNRLTDTVGWLIRSTGRLCSEAKLELADLKLLMAHEAWSQLLDLLCAHLTATEAGLGLHERLTRQAALIPPDQVTPPPLLSGDDLCDLGVSPGPRVGQILRTVYRSQLNDQTTTRTEALALAHRLIADRA